MKLKLIILFFLIAFVAKAQQPLPGSYITNNNLDKFVGTWKWTDNATNSEVVIKLKKFAYYTSLGQYNRELIIGCHSYMQNGIILENNLSLFPTIGQDENSSIFVYGNINGLDPNFVNGSFKNLTKNKTEYLQFTYINSTPPTLDWYLSERNEVTSFVIVGASPPDPSINAIILPHKIILVKQP